MLAGPSVECRNLPFPPRNTSAMSAPPVLDAPLPFDASWRQEAGSGLDADGLALIDQAVAWSVPRFEGQQALTGEPLASHGAGVVRLSLIHI